VIGAKRHRIVNVFVLGTGRCGTVTFARACEHIGGFTAGHETRARQIGDARFDYPADHIEVDNRLSWFLGGLGRRFDDDSTLYVHLTRDRSAVVESFERRWDSAFRASIIRAFGHGIVSRSVDWSLDERREVCGFYVDTVNQNVAEFVAGRQSIALQLELLDEQFVPFAERIGGRVDADAALAALRIRHNSSDHAAGRPEPDDRSDQL
jgi:hypothetical protein